MPKNYFSTETGATAAERLDQAWLDYKNKTLSQREHKNALNYLLHVFDIHHFTHQKNVLNGLLKDLMDLREQHKKENPDYIPMLSSGNYELDVNARMISRIPLKEEKEPDLTLIALSENQGIQDIKQDVLKKAQNNGKPILIKLADNTCFIYGDKGEKWDFTPVKIDKARLSELPFQDGILYRAHWYRLEKGYGAALAYMRDPPPADGNIQKMKQSDVTNLYLYKENDERYCYRIGDDRYYLKDVPEKLKTMQFDLDPDRDVTFCEDREIDIPVLNSTFREGHTRRYNSLFDEYLTGVVNQGHISKQTPEAVKEAIKQERLLDPPEFVKYKDKNQIEYLDNKKRDEFNIQISNGAFYKSGKIFDSSEFISHGKPHYASFTFNANGEISVFSHHGKEGLKHVSMNAGAPVLAAGEIKISNGKLESITSYSGHYKPTLYSVSRFLEYVSSKGVDISETKVYLQENPDKEKTGLDAKQIRMKHGYKDENNQWQELKEKKKNQEICYKVSASDLVFNSQSILDSNIKSINEFLEGRKSRIQIFKKPTLEEQIAKDFRDEMTYATTFLKSASSMSLSELDDFLKFHETMIKRYQVQVQEEMARQTKSKKPVEGLHHLLSMFNHMETQNKDLKQKHGVNAKDSFSSAEESKAREEKQADRIAVFKKSR